MEDLEFGGWDPYSDDAYTSAMKAGVLKPDHLESIGDELRLIKPMPAVFSPDWVRRLEGYDQVKDARTKMDQAELLMEDIERFRTEHECETAGDGVVRLHRGLPRGDCGSPGPGVLRGRA